MSDETITYEGDNITIEEMPQGCVISQESLDGFYEDCVVITSTRDALAVIASLEKMIRIQLGEEENEN